LLTVRVKATIWPASGAGSSMVLVRLRSASGIVSTSVAVLLAGVGSAFFVPSSAITAVLETCVRADAIGSMTVTTKLTLDVALAATVPMARVHVLPGPLPEAQTQPMPV
jgi:uncharacterized membrane protein YbhN (UPF0104 family)